MFNRVFTKKEEKTNERTNEKFDTIDRVILDNILLLKYFEFCSNQVKMGYVMKINRIRCQSMCE